MWNLLSQRFLAKLLTLQMKKCCVKDVVGRDHSTLNYFAQLGYVYYIQENRQMKKTTECPCSGALSTCRCAHSVIFVFSRLALNSLGLSLQIDLEITDSNARNFLP